METLIRIAVDNNFKFDVVGDKIRVYDTDGQIITDSKNELLNWLGY